MTACGAPDCHQPPVQQWQRAGTPDEATQHHATLHAGRMQLVNHQRTQATLHLVELRARHQRITDAAAAGDPDARRILHASAAQVTAAESVAAGIPDPTPAPLEPVTVAVFACQDHAIDDDRAARGLHESSCLTDGTCTCTITPPPAVDAE